MILEGTPGPTLVNQVLEPLFLLFPGSSMQEKSEDSMPTTDTGHEPQAPITRRGFLTSFKTGKAMNIPETDVVSSVELRLQ